MLQVARSPTLVAAIAVALLACYILWLGPGRRLHRAAALFLLLRAGIGALVSFTPGAASPLAWTTVYLDIALPFAILNFVYVFRAEHGPRRALYSRRNQRIVRGALLVAFLVLELLYFLRHDWFGSVDARGFLDRAWLSLAVPLKIPLLAFAAVILGRTANRFAAVEERRALSLFALGLVVEPAFRVFFQVGTLLRVRSSELWLFETLFVVVGIFLVLLYIVDLVVMRTIRHRDDRLARLSLGLVSLAIATGLMAQVLLVTVTASTALFVVYAIRTLDALWLLVLVTLVSYATVMHRLFDVDLKAKALLNGSTIAAGIGFVLVVTGEGLERVLPIDNSGLALIAAVLIAMLLRPLQHLARRVGDWALPGVQNEPAYHERRKAQIYRAALEGVYRDGEISPTERNVLKGLRAEIGLDVQDAERLETEVRAIAGLPPVASGRKRRDAAGGVAKLP